MGILSRAAGYLGELGTEDRLFKLGGLPLGGFKILLLNAFA